MPIDFNEINRIEKIARPEFNNAFSVAKSQTSLFTSEMNDTEQLTVWEFMGQMPNVTEWVGAREIEDMNNYDYSIKVKDWSLLQKLKYAKAWNASKTGLSKFYLRKIGELGKSFKEQHPNDLIIKAIEDGTSNLAYDDIAFFNDGGVRKDWAGNNKSNLLTGAGVTTANLETDLEACRVAMAGFTGDKGRNLNLHGNLIICPPALYKKFSEILGTAFRDSSDNIMYGAYTIVQDNRLTDSNDWYFVDTSKSLKPILYVSVGDVNFAIKDTTFDDKNILFGADSTGNIGYSFPEMMIKVANA